MPCFALRTFARENPTHPLSRIVLSFEIIHSNSDPVDLADWDEEKVKELVEAFLQVKEGGYIYPHFIRIGIFPSPIWLV